ncbi:MAG: hypothetical protein ABFS86_18955, partial [Planctomycetota bacterium]
MKWRKLDCYYVDGPASLSLAAMRRHGMPAEHPVAQACLEVLLETDGEALSNYEAGCILLGIRASTLEPPALGGSITEGIRAADRRKPADRLRKNSSRLQHSIIAQREVNGWREVSTHPDVTLLVTAFSVLGLAAAEHVGQNCSLATWKDVRQAMS